MKRSKIIFLERLLIGELSTQGWTRISRAFGKHNGRISDSNKLINLFICLLRQTHALN